MKWELLYDAFKFKVKYRIHGLPCYIIAYLMSFPGNVEEIIFDEDSTLTGLKLIYKLREQVDNSIKVKVESEGLHGYGYLDKEIITFFKRILAFQTEFTDILIGGDRFRYVLEHSFGYDFPERYAPLLHSRGMRYCVVDNLLGNLMGYYKGNLLDDEDLDYLFALFEDLARQGANYVLVPGNEQDARVQIREW